MNGVKPYTMNNSFGIAFSLLQFNNKKLLLIVTKQNFVDIGRRIYLLAIYHANDKLAFHGEVIKLEKRL